MSDTIYTTAWSLSGPDDKDKILRDVLAAKERFEFDTSMLGSVLPAPLFPWRPL